MGNDIRHHGLVDALLLVDLDNTLVDRAAGFDRWASAFLHDIGKTTDSQMSWLQSVDEDGMATREMFFKAVKHRYGLREPTDALVAKYRSEFPSFVPSPTPATLL